MAKDSEEKKTGNFGKKVRFYLTLVLIVALVIIYYSMKAKVTVAMVRAKFYLTVAMWIIIIALILLAIIKIKSLIKGKKSK